MSTITIPSQTTRQNAIYTYTDDKHGS